ncbi:MAG: bifunctional DNA primase/polymerase [Planctomycetes bacterium]|nr:bifunctional DNA primase/polymerase [Planctomycetota bacterium]
MTAYHDELVASAVALARIGLRVFPVAGIVEAAGVDGSTGEATTERFCGCYRDRDRHDHHCKKPGKHPLVKGWKDKATADPRRAEAAFRQTRYAEANLGVATGRGSNVFVLDVDKRHNGPAVLEALEATRGGLPETLTQETGSGGRQHFFRWPGVKVPNDVSLFPGIDVRGDGGLVVVPPSRHLSGGAYRWHDADPGEVPIAEAPAWLLEALKVTKREARTRHGAEGGAGDERFTLPPEIREGSRNATLFRLACSLRAYGYGEQEIRAAIAVANERCRTADSAEAGPLAGSELEQIAASACKYEPGPGHRDEGDANPAHTGGAAAGPGDPFTDLGNARLLVSLHGERIRYCHPWKKWLVYDGTRWRVDDTAEVLRLARDLPRHWYSQAADLADKAKRKRVAAWAKHCEGERILSAAVSLARSEPGVPILPRELDRDPWLLCARNGTVDLRTGTLGPHGAKLYMTKLAPVEYDPAAEAPEWRKFMLEIMDGREDLAAFLQRAAGYSASGDTRERCFFLLWGTGKNGKSVFLTTFRNVLGDYATKTPVETICVKRGEAIPNDVARLHGTRFVYCAESGEGKILNEALVKDLTGREHVTARFLYAEYFDFIPNFKLWLGTNHKPIVRGGDNAIWDRVRLVPFTVRFDGPREIKALDDLLLAEGPGILNWIVAGCLAWQRDGLREPKEVLAATAKYREDSDLVGEFVTECCLESPRLSTRAFTLYRAYRQWAEDSGLRPMSQRAFGERLQERGYARARGTGGPYVYHGVGLLQAAASEGSERSEPISGKVP